MAPRDRLRIDTIPAMTLPVLALVLVGFAIAWPLTAVMGALGRRWAALDSPGAAGHRKELRPIPNTGGLAIFLAVAGPMALGLLALALVDDARWREWLPALVDHLPRVRQSMPTAAALLACLAALHVTGLLDDRRSLGPWPKFAVQLAAATVMVVWFEVRLLELLGQPLSIVVTILWIVAVTNAINFMDNMDGLAAGVSAIAAGLFMVAAMLNAQWFIAATLALLIGALLAFLIFNFPPASIFMGDSGSLVVGFLLAILTARTTYYNPEHASYPLGGGWYGVFMPVIVLAIPLYDFVSVTILRLMQGRSPLVGDQQHFSHRLVQRGLSRRGAVMVIWGATAVTGIGGISLGSLQGWQAILVGVQTLLVLLVIAILEHASRHARRN